MSLHLQNLLSKTELKNKDCVQQFLEAQGFTTLSAIDNLPGKYGQPWLCENGTTVVVSELRRVIQEENDALPTIDEAMAAEPEPEPEREVLQGDTLVTDLNIDGVSQRQLKSIEESGVKTLGDLFENEEALEQIPGIGKATKDRILQAVTEALERK